MDHSSYTRDENILRMVSVFMAHPGICYNYPWLCQCRSRPLYGRRLRTQSTTGM